MKATPAEIADAIRTGRLGTAVIAGTRAASVPDVPDASPVKRAKYGNRVSVDADGIRWHSDKERRRYAELVLLERDGQIANLERQKRYQIDWNGVRICSYVADFVYEEMPLRALVVEDCKGMRTREYKTKAKLMLAAFGITIRET